MTTSTFLKMPRRSSFCRASCDFRITCTTNWIMFWCQDLLLTGTNCTESIRPCCVHLHQSNFLPGKLLQFHKLTGPPWFYRARLCALFEPQPEKQECVRNRQQDRVQVRELWDYCLKQILHSCFPELLVLAPDQALVCQCHLVELQALAHAWAEGPGSATQRYEKKSIQ